LAQSHFQPSYKKQVAYFQVTARWDRNLRNILWYGQLFYRDSLL